MLQRFLLVWLILLAVIAYFWPSVGLTACDPFVATKTHGWLMPIIALAMFAIGCLLPPAEVKRLPQWWPAVLGGTAVQYSVMPLLAWGVGVSLSLPPDLLTGVIMVGCVPGAMASNVLTLAARGNVSYSICLTTSANLFSPIVVPIVLSSALGVSQGIAQHFDPLQLFRELIFSVVGPVVIGYLSCRCSRKFETLMTRLGPWIANGTILWIIAVVVGLNRDRLISATPWLLLSLLLINLLGYAAGWLGGYALSLPASMRRALTLEVGMQNAGLGTGLVLTLFPDYPAAAIPTAAYTFGCMLTGTVLATIWSNLPTTTTVDPNSVSHPQ